MDNFKLNAERLLDARLHTENYFKHLIQLYSTTDFQSIGDAIELLNQARLNSKRIYVAGNGGSASIANHMATDMLSGLNGAHYKLEKPFKIHSLSSNDSTITALANDYGYAEIFSRQIQLLAEKGDLLVTFSVSGHSENILRAIGAAKELEVKTLGIVGFDGGELKQIADHIIHINNSKGDYGPAEDFFMAINHIFVTYFDKLAQQ